MTPDKSGFTGGCRTTAMGIMPHRDIEKALQFALSLDIPFWPQLPNVSYYEDMYVQASEYFPGIVVDVENKRIGFDSARFEEDLTAYSGRMEKPETFTLSETYSGVYRRFLSEDLSRFYAVRGQMIGPVSFGFKVADENNVPIIYNEQVRSLLFDFIQRKVNAQFHELRQKNRNAFVWLDEPGLGWVFSGLSGYNDIQAKREYRDFLDGLDRPGALHLCANVYLPYLLSLGVGLLSFDAYQLELMPRGYAGAVAGFLEGGGTISWGIVPTDSLALNNETPESLVARLLGYWKVVSENSAVPVKQIADQALVAPARCCLKNIGQVGASNDMAISDGQGICDLTLEERVVERAFDYLKALSAMLKDRFAL